MLHFRCGRNSAGRRIDGFVGDGFGQLGRGAFIGLGPNAKKVFGVFFVHFALVVHFGLLSGIHFDGAEFAKERFALEDQFRRQFLVVRTDPPVQKVPILLHRRGYRWCRAGIRRTSRSHPDWRWRRERRSGTGPSSKRRSAAHHQEWIRGSTHVRRRGGSWGSHPGPHWRPGTEALPIFHPD